MADILVSVVTYRRNIELQRLLVSLQAESSADFDVLIVDNDPEGKARETAVDFNTGYVHEPVPGIAAARNAALSEARKSKSRWLIFVDDDEVVTRGWVTHLLSQPATVVAGGVRPHFPDGAEGQFRLSGLYAVETGGAGAKARWPATNNVAIDLDFVRVYPNLSFATELGLTGGSDVDFFMQISRLGGRLIWQPEATVDEYVDPVRLSSHWLVRRAIRIGATLAICERRNFGRNIFVLRLAKGCFNIAAGSIGLAQNALLRKQPERLRSLFRLSRGVGSLLGLLGITPVEYERADGRTSYLRRLPRSMLLYREVSIHRQAYSEEVSAEVLSCPIVPQFRSDD